jgi:hypothetical protein
MFAIWVTPIGPRPFGEGARIGWAGAKLRSSALTKTAELMMRFVTRVGCARERW